MALYSQAEQGFVNDGIFYLLADENKNFIRVVTNVHPKPDSSQLGDGIPPIYAPINDLDGIVEDRNLAAITKAACWTGLLHKEEGQFIYIPAVGDDEPSDDDITRQLNPASYVKKTKTRMSNYFMGQIGERTTIPEIHMMFTKLKYINSYEYIGPIGDPEIDYAYYAIYNAMFQDHINVRRRTDIPSTSRPLDAGTLISKLVNRTYEKVEGSDIPLSYSLSNLLVDSEYDPIVFLKNMYKSYVGNNTYVDQFFYKNKTIPLISYYLPPSVRGPHYEANRYIIESRRIDCRFIEDITVTDESGNTVDEDNSDYVGRMMVNQTNYITKDVIVDDPNSSWLRGWNDSDPEYRLNGIRPTRTKTSKWSLCHPIENTTTGAYSFRIVPFPYRQDIEESVVDEFGDSLQGKTVYRVDLRRLDEIVKQEEIERVIPGPRTEVDLSLITGQHISTLIGEEDTYTILPELRFKNATRAMGYLYDLTGTEDWESAIDQWLDSFVLLDDGDVYKLTIATGKGGTGYRSRLYDSEFLFEGDIPPNDIDRFMNHMLWRGRITTTSILDIVDEDLYNRALQSGGRVFIRRKDASYLLMDNSLSLYANDIYMLSAFGIMDQTYYMAKVAEDDTYTSTIEELIKDSGSAVKDEVERFLSNAERVFTGALKIGTDNEEEFLQKILSIGISIDDILNESNYRVKSAVDAGPEYYLGSLIRTSLGAAYNGTNDQTAKSIAAFRYMTFLNSLNYLLLEKTGKLEDAVSNCVNQLGSQDTYYALEGLLYDNDMDMMFDVSYRVTNDTDNEGRTSASSFTAKDSAIIYYNTLKLNDDQLALAYENVYQFVSTAFSTYTTTTDEYVFDNVLTPARDEYIDENLSTYYMSGPDELTTITKTVREYDEESIGSLTFETLEEIAVYLQQYDNQHVIDRRFVENIIRNPETIISTRDQTNMNNTNYKVSIFVETGQVIVRYLPYIEPGSECIRNNLMSEYTYFRYFKERASRIIEPEEFENPCYKYSRSTELVVNGEPDLIRLDRVLMSNNRFYFTNIGGAFENYTNSDYDSNWLETTWLNLQDVLVSRSVEPGEESTLEQNVEDQRIEQQYGLYSLTITETNSSGEVTRSEEFLLNSLDEAYSTLLTEGSPSDLTVIGLQQLLDGNVYTISDTKSAVLVSLDYGNADAPVDSTSGNQIAGLQQNAAFRELVNERDPNTGRLLNEERGYINLDLSALYQANINANYSLHIDVVPGEQYSYKEEEKRFYNVMTGANGSTEISNSTIHRIVNRETGEYVDISDGDELPGGWTSYRKYSINYTNRSIRVYFIAEIYPGIEKKLLLTDFDDRDGDTRYPSFYRVEKDEAITRLTELTLNAITSVINDLETYYVPSTGSLFLREEDMPEALQQRWVGVRTHFKNAVHENNDFFIEQGLEGVDFDATRHPIEEDIIDLRTRLKGSLPDWNSLIEQKEKAKFEDNEPVDSAAYAQFSQLRSQLELTTRMTILPLLKQYQERLEAYELTRRVNNAQESRRNQTAYTELTKPTWLREFIHVQTNIPPSIHLGQGRGYVDDLERYSYDWYRTCNALTWWSAFKSYINTTKLVNYYLKWIYNTDTVMKDAIDALYDAGYTEDDMKRFIARIFTDEYENYGINSTKISIIADNEGSQNTSSGAYEVDDQGYYHFVGNNQGSYDDRYAHRLQVFCNDTLSPTPSKMKEDLRNFFLNDYETVRYQYEVESQSDDTDLLFIDGYEERYSI